MSRPMMPYTNYTVRLGDLKEAILRNPYDPNRNTINAYMRYLKYNTPYTAAPGAIGKWITIKSKTGGRFYWYECSLCRYESHDWTKFCPGCGAYMREDEVENED